MICRERYFSVIVNNDRQSYLYIKYNYLVTVAALFTDDVLSTPRNYGNVEFDENPTRCFSKVFCWKHVEIFLSETTFVTSSQHKVQDTSGQYRPPFVYSLLMISHRTFFCSNLCLHIHVRLADNLTSSECNRRLNGWFVSLKEYS